MNDDIQEALRESEQRYRTLFDQAPVGVYVYDRTLHITACNPRFATILSSTRERLEGLDLRSLRDKRVLPAIEAALTGEPAHYAGPYQSTTSGARVWVSMRISALRDRAGVIVGGMGMVEDITDQRLAEEALRASEARFRTVVELSPDLVGVMRNGRLLYSNPACARNWGYDSPSELAGKAVEELIHPDDVAVFRDRVIAQSGGATLPPHEYRIARKDGNFVHNEITSIVIDYDGTPALLAIGRDVTERKLMQARLLQADRMVSVGTLAAGVAHEINNPLAYLMANLELIAHRSLPDLAARIRKLELEVATAKGETEPRLELSSQFTRVAEMIDIARAGAERVRHTVRDLKTFSRSDEERRTPIDVRTVLDASINIAWNEIRHRAALAREYDEVLPVLANEARLGQVFLNLLLNAAQALPVGSATVNKIRVRTFQESGRVVVEVRDTGPGIAKEHLPRLFDPFFTTKPVGVGTGLGLWICQGIVTSLGGTIVASSDPGSETTLRIELPAHVIGVPAPARAPSESKIRASRRGRVLIVDDEAPLARALAAALSEEHDVVIATDSREALARLTDGADFDVVLCDLMMPDVTGMDLYERLKASLPEMAERIIFLTGGAFTPRAREFLDTVPNERVDKPFDMDRLRALLRTRIV